MAGRAMVPAGGVMPIKASKLAPLTPWPISHSPALRAMPPVAGVPE